MSILTEEDAAADEKFWYFKLENGVLELKLVSDTKTAHTTLRVERQGINIINIAVDGEYVYQR